MAAGYYEAAISLYEALAGFHDTSANYEAVRITWAASDPSLLLPAGGLSARQRRRGTGSAPKSTPWRFDSERRVYYAAWDGQAQADGAAQPAASDRSRRAGLTVEDRLSSSVSLSCSSEADSHSRAAVYIAYTAANNQRQRCSRSRRTATMVGGGATFARTLTRPLREPRAGWPPTSVKATPTNLWGSFQVRIMSISGGAAAGVSRARRSASPARSPLSAKIGAYARMERPLYL